MIYDWERFSAGVGGEPDEGEDAQEGGPLVVLLEGPQLRVQPGRSRFRTRPTQLYQNQNQKYFIDPRGGNCCMHTCMHVHLSVHAFLCKGGHFDRGIKKVRGLEREASCIRLDVI